MKLEIPHVIGKNLAILHTDGLVLFEKMNATPGPIVISFKGVESCTTAFLNASIGKFLFDNPSRAGDLSFEGMEQDEYLKSKVELVKENVMNEKKRNSLDASSRGSFHA